MKICYDSRFLKRALAVWGILQAVCWFRTATTWASELDSLRVVIRSLQHTIEQQQAVITELSKDFNTTNSRVYKYKAEQNGGINPFSRLRMQNALKTSHQLADSLDAVSKQLRNSKSRLQRAYAAAIRQIDQEMQHELAVLKLNRQDRRQRKRRLALIKSLEKEKAEYAARLQTMKIDQKGWEKILVEPEDTLRRLKLKVALLDDFLQTLQESLHALQTDSQKNQSDRKTYSELLDFYKELDESLDDDQDIFDRNRLEELQDKIENLNGEYDRLRQRTSSLTRDITVLKAKIERFKTAIAEKQG